VALNAETYAEQAFRVLGRSQTRVRYNGEWLSELSLVDLIKLGQNFTIQQFLARENFARRLEKDEPIYLHEMFYALMQGYDAVALKTDVQVGGTDQLFNIIVAGRKLQEAMGQRPLVGVICGILPGTDGVERMSKSKGNHIPLLTSPEDMYGKVMSLPDVAMPVYFKLVTRYTPEQVASVEKDLADGSRHPRDIKMELAREIVAIYWGADRVAAAEEHFKSVFQKGQVPEEMETVSVAGEPALVDFLVEHKLAASKGEARRLMEQNGVKVAGRTVSDVTARLVFKGEAVVQVGKRRFVRVKKS